MAHTLPIGLEGLLELSLVPMLIMDDSQRFVGANAALCTLLDLPRREVVGRSVSDLTPADLQDQIEPTWNEFMSRGTLVGSWKLRTGSGKPVGIDYSTTANVGPGKHLAIVTLEARDLTPREKEVLSCLAMGMTGKECAEELSVSLDTIQKHVGSAKAKLGAHTRAHAVLLALQTGRLATSARD